MRLMTTQVDELVHERRVLLDRLATLGLGGPLFSSPSWSDSSEETAEEAEVLFTLMAERYERRSLIITSNLVFSEWDRIFKTPMATAAAIDRLRPLR